ncbi:Phosphatidylglycerophosphate synthase [Streptomyces sp. 2224.1]|nr:phosphatidylglycerophosphate synthase [Streptomyces sp. 2321.6]SDQ91838.1 Phosphatidylglycerophosphate synthase [Streptomyces sp. KS_16]SED75283.1 Phosphatidylglycerophosphate synthase [Streptomyces sp. 2112.3]SED92184.1 Phosphatidylglycerophosphate synthase [Streptomyces sp. 2133.1]SED97037.1 Phosphatidylglycerophosphate synthase [Streptomyces sp. 2224.1]SNC73115.1 Phosphatidylglycerophosphate synthase [Streptomyces sp. 2114.4]
MRIADDAASAAELLAAVPAQERVAVVDPRFVGHLHALRLALTDPRFPAAAVPGALTAQPEARAALARAVGRIPVGAGTAHLTDVLTDTLTESLDREVSGLHRVELGSLVATVALTPAQREDAREAVAAVDDEAVRLRTAVKSRDGFFTTYCISPYSRYLARWCARRGLTPNQVTTASLLTALIAAGCAATGSRGGFVVAGLLLLFSFVLDCTDGQLARYSLQYSTMGAWLDATFDRAKEYAYYAGLALGAARGGDDVWALALGAMVLMTCRHVVDFSFNEANHDATANTSPTAALSGKLDSVGWTVWVRRMIVLPIGERWAMIAVLTALTTPRIVFYALLIGCALAACYTTAGRVLRSLTRRARRTDRAAQALADLADSGPLAELIAGRGRGRGRTGSFLAPVMAFLSAAVLLVWVIFQDDPRSWLTVGVAVCSALLAGAAVARPLKGALDWLVPPFFRAGEYVTILVLAARTEAPGALPAAFGLVAALAYHHYDTVYRIRGGTGAPPRWLVRATGGHEGRILVITVLAAALFATDFTIALTALAVVLALLVLIESIRFWVSSQAPAVHDEGEPA